MAKTAKLRFAYVDPSEVRDNEANWRTHPSEQVSALEQIYEDVGDAGAAVINERDTAHGWPKSKAGLVYVDGHLRKQVKLKRGEKLPAVIGHWTPKQEREILGTHDLITVLAGTDVDKLSELARENDFVRNLLEQEVSALSAIQRSEQAVLDGLRGEEGKEEKESPEQLLDRSDEIQEKWHCAVGDTWIIGEHRLFCCDSEKKFAQLVRGVKAKIVFTDPPYGINVVSNFTRTDGAGKEITIASGTIRARGAYPFRGKKGMRGTDGAAHWVDATLYKPVRGDDKPFDPAWLLELAPHQIIWGGNYFASKVKDSRCWIVWNKNNTGHFADAELAWTNFEKGVRLYSHTWNGLVRAGDRRVEGKKRLHPTQKPATLCAEIIRDFTEEGDIVFDPYAGSGSTLVGCEMARRVGYVAESEPAYCAVICERLSLLGLKPQLSK